MKRLVLLFILSTSTTIAAQQTLSIDDCRAKDSRIAYSES